MLSVARLKADRRAYYCDELAAGLEDYYLGIGEAPGHWVGRGAKILGLAGAVVDSEGFDAILDGRDPTTGTELAEHSVRVLGYDATFCAPKSVSVLYGLGSPAVGRSSARAAQLAAYATRGPKDRQRGPEELRAEWWRQAHQLGVTEEAVASWTGPGREIGASTPPTRPDAPRSWPHHSGACGGVEGRTTPIGAIGARAGAG